ncbi:chromosome partition protein Smc-like [Harmonia axyridis]|uniref:chromosome partition protein Smc-like n=1 Tax=Harmonia axyridis TaxID=115357 RepID=UPI001E275370|nr:chromosome partition protein Smc-like [Harmonia axyridis]
MQEMSEIMDLAYADDTTGGEDEDDLKEVDDIILKASKELEQVAEENQHLLELLEKPQKHPFAPEENQTDFDNNVIKQLEDAERKAKDTANKIYELKTRVGELLKKEELNEPETLELDIKNRELKEQMKLFEERTKRIQYLIEKTNFINQDPEETTQKEETSFKKPKEQTTPKILACNPAIGENVKKSCCSCCSENIRKIPSVPTFAKKLTQSYNMQEKLAAENADLESVRFKLQEELLNKDQSLECLQRELGNLQNEMRILARENITLNEKLMSMQQNESKESIKTKPTKSFMTSKKLQEYSDNTYELEKQLMEMENDVKCLHEEICAVQREREHLEKHRKMMTVPKNYMAPHIVPAFNAPTPMHNSRSQTLNKGVPTQLIQELFEQYDKLENDLKFKINGVLTLKNDYENLKKMTKEADEYKRTTQEKVKKCEKIMNKIRTENEIPAEQEHQILTAKKRLKKAQDTLKEEQQIIKDQKKLVEDITSKFLEAQQQIEAQRRNLDVKFENTGDCNLNLGAQIVTNLHDKLEEISL